jgi:biotin-dependent carboxylase-like uncharacterized protein
MIEILLNSALATIQDGGRLGHYRDGVSRSGAMDGVALALGNALLGNDRNAAGIEIPILPFSVRFDTDLDIAVTGADCDARLGDTALPPDWAIRARAGDVLTLRAPLGGCRAYLSVGGGIDVPEVLGSRSTQLRERFGGLDGRMLQKGDRLRALRTETLLPEGGLGAVPPQPSTLVRVLPAAEYGLFAAEAQRSLWEAEWTVTPQSNRAGYRLSGPELQLMAPVEMRSHGVVPGVIQVPHGGQPIIQLADAATMGGYPKIGTVIEADLWRLGQVRPGEHIRFLETDYQGAVAALNELEAALADAEAMANRVRGAIRGWTG